MRISLNSIKKYTPIELGVDELVVRINQRLGQVEATEDMADKYKDAVVVRLVACEKHPNADKLSVCIIDDGSKVADAPRDSDGYVQVVCGAPNARADMFAVWLPPKSIVPASYGDDEPFVLDARELRGVMSQGMLAAADELGVGSDHTGIVELSEYDISPESSIKQLQPGQSFAEVFGRDRNVVLLVQLLLDHVDVPALIFRIANPMCQGIAQSHQRNVLFRNFFGTCCLGGIRFFQIHFVVGETVHFNNEKAPTDTNKTTPKKINKLFAFFT